MLLKIVTVFLVIGAIIIATANHNVIRLQTYEWNGGHVRIRERMDKNWTIDVLTTAYCIRLDRSIYESEDGYYYKVNCDGQVGFVSTLNVK